MTLIPLSKSQITLPALYSEKKRIGKNLLVHLVQNKKIIQGEVYAHEVDKRCLVFKDEQNIKYYLKFKGSRADLSKADFALKVDGDFRDISQLSEQTKLEWLNHPQLNEQKSPAQIVSSWKNSFNFHEEDSNKKSLGLRRPQLGALHSIAAHWSITGAPDPATIVLPTGTGKTETMLATLVYKQCSKVLVLVPTDPLRNQIFEKFSSLGCLPEINVVNNNIIRPRVALVNHGISDLKENSELIKNANVIVTIPNTLAEFSDAAREELAKQCSHLFIDEAHHITAPMWKQIKDLFKNKPVLQFTATPFREDKQNLAGKIIYNYPIGKAQEDGYFEKINLKTIIEYDDLESDKKIAEAAIKILDIDLSNSLDHILMARVNNIMHAEQLLPIYKQLAPAHNPIIVHSKMRKQLRDRAFSEITTGKSRIIICVNMLGEGFNFPNLKIAAIHDIHKSFGITLQFIGRFTRKEKAVGEATVVVNIADPQVSAELDSLYSENSDWNKMLKRKSEEAIRKEIALQDLVESFDGELSRQISLWNLRPAFSTLIFKTDCVDWTPMEFINILPAKGKYWHAISKSENILIIVAFKQEEVKWGKYKNIKESLFDLLIANWSREHNTLFMHCSDYNAFDTGRLASGLCGNSCSPIIGASVFRIFSEIERPMVSSLGASKAGAIRYTMYFGPDVAIGLSQVEKAESNLNNIFGWGYENGVKITIGCSAKRGKIWARGGAPITEWRDWCNHVVKKITNDDIEEKQLIKDFLRPVELQVRPELIPVSVEWGEYIIREPEERVSVFFDENEIQAFDVSLSIRNFSKTGQLQIEISTENNSSIYELDINNKYAPNGFKYLHQSGPTIFIRKGRQKLSFDEYMKIDPVLIIYADGSFSYNKFHVPIPKADNFFKTESLIENDWKDIDIRIESQGPQRKKNSIQFRMVEFLYDDFDIILNDDGAGEAADLIAIKKESDESLKLCLVHCKFSSEDKPGARILDMYALCGQAQKSIRWKHNGMRQLVDHHIKNRENSWIRKNGVSRFLKGDMRKLKSLRNFARIAKTELEVIIAQPGLSKSKVSSNILQLLGCTELYLKKTADAQLKVVCSK